MSARQRLPRHEEHIVQARQLKKKKSKVRKDRPASAPNGSIVFVPRPAREGAPAVEDVGRRRERGGNGDGDGVSAQLARDVLVELRSQRRVLEAMPDRLFRVELRHHLAAAGGGGNNMDDRAENADQRPAQESKTSANYQELSSGASAGGSSAGGGGDAGDARQAGDGGLGTADGRPLPERLVRKLSEAYLHNAHQTDAMSERVAALAEAQQQAAAALQHNKGVLDGMSTDFYKLLLEQVAWIMVELKVAKADRTAASADAAANLSAARRAQNQPQQTGGASTGLQPLHAGGTAGHHRGAGSNMSVRAVQSIEARLDALAAQQDKITRTQASNYRRIQDSLAQLSEGGTMKAMASDLMGNLIAQVDDVSKNVRRLLGGASGGLPGGRIAGARAAEAKAKETLEETKRLVTSFNEHIIRQHQELKRDIVGNRWSMEATAKSFEKALAFHLGIIYNNGATLAPMPANHAAGIVPAADGAGAQASVARPRSPYANSPTKARDTAAAARHAALLSFGHELGEQQHYDDPTRVRPGSPVDATVATGLDGRYAHHDDAGRDEDEDDGRNMGYRYEPPQRTVAGLGQAQAKALHTSVLKSASYLQRLEEVTKQRVQMLDRGEFVTERLFKTRMRLLTDAVREVLDAVVANGDPSRSLLSRPRPGHQPPTSSVASSRRSQRRPGGSDAGGGGGGSRPASPRDGGFRPYSPLGDSSDDGGPGPDPGRDEEKRTESKHQADGGGGAAAGGASPELVSALQGAAAAAATAADKAAAASTRAATAANDASSATTESISAALAAAAAAREATAAAKEAAAAAKGAAGAVGNLSQRIDALAHSVAAINEGQEGIREAVQEALGSLSNL